MINRDFLLKLLSQVGPSGDEGRASRVWQEEAKNFAKKYIRIHMEILTRSLGMENPP